MVIGHPFIQFFQKCLFTFFENRIHVVFFLSVAVLENKYFLSETGAPINDKSQWQKSKTQDLQLHFAPIV